jgi:lysophospholipase L1-like esterase
MCSFSVGRRALRLGLGLVVGACMLLVSAAPGSAKATRTAQRSSHNRTAQRSSHNWVATWAAAVQAPSSVSLSTFGEPASLTVSGLDDQTVRNIVFTSVGGQVARIHLSNTFGTQPLVVGSATMGVELAAAQLVPGTIRSVTFNGRSSVTIPAGGQAISDPVRLAVHPLEDLAVSLYLPNATGPATNHFASQQTNYVASGDQTAQAPPTAYSALASIPPGGSSWFYVSGVDVRPSRASGATVVAFGDSITDGWQSQIGANDRWPSLLAKRLVAALGDRAPGIVDEGIGGNRVLNDSPCFGQSALTRFGRDVLSVPNVRDVILLEGINDIGFSQQPNTGCSVPNTNVSAEQIINGYRQIIALAHTHGLKIFGGTLVPFKGAAYWSPAAEVKRDTVNNWILTSHAFDGVVDFARATEDPYDPQYLDPAYNSGDNLHPNDAGYQAMANAINLAMLVHQ